MSDDALTTQNWRLHSHTNVLLVEQLTQSNVCDFFTVQL